MNKKIILIIVISLLIIGGIIGFWLKAKSPSKQDATIQTSQNVVWNPYATAENYQASLPDQLISADNGQYVVKMSISLSFTDKDAYGKFEGYQDKKDSDNSVKTPSSTSTSTSSGTSSSSSSNVTPMELKIDDIIGNLMMTANQDQIMDRNTLNNYLKDGINHKLGLTDPIVKEVFIENYVVQ